MKRTAIALMSSFALVLVSLAANAHAQKPAKVDPAPRAAKSDPAPRAAVATPNGDSSANEPVRHSQTPEMWLYEQQLRRYEDPRYAVREKAEFRANQRQQRLAALDWYGFSNSRPRVNPTPWGATYSPSWAGGTARPYSWIGPRQAIVIPVGDSATR